MRQIFIILSLFCIFKLPASEESVNASYQKLDQLAIDAGTDKSSTWHNYTKVYAKIFDEIKDRPIKFLEIGIYKGASAKMWEGFFSKGDLYFIDQTDKLIEYYSTRSKYFFLDQANPTDLYKFAQDSGGGFDVIIDDGGHTMNQQMISFAVLFPHLKKGGIYVIEDLSTSYWKSYGGLGSFENPKASPHSTTEFLKKLTDELNYFAARTACADFDKLDNNFKAGLEPYQKLIESITFYPNLCILIKR